MPYNKRKEILILKKATKIGATIYETPSQAAAPGSCPAGPGAVLRRPYRPGGGPAPSAGRKPRKPPCRTIRPRPLQKRTRPASPGPRRLPPAPLKIRKTPPPQRRERPLRHRRTRTRKPASPPRRRPLPPRIRRSTTIPSPLTWVFWGGSTEKVAEGEIPPLVPWIGELPHAEILGWFDEQGNQVDPETTPVTRDVTYTARWSRNVEELLNTEDHVTYVSGYESGLFSAGENHHPGRGGLHVLQAAALCGLGASDLLRCEVHRLVCRGGGSLGRPGHSLRL